MKIRKLIALALLLASLVAGVSINTSADPWPDECGIWTYCG